MTNSDDKRVAELVRDHRPKALAEMLVEAWKERDAARDAHALALARELVMYAGAIDRFPPDRAAEMHEAARVIREFVEGK